MPTKTVACPCPSLERFEFGRLVDLFNSSLALLESYDLNNGRGCRCSVIVGSELVIDLVEIGPFHLALDQKV